MRGSNCDGIRTRATCCKVQNWTNVPSHPSPPQVPLGQIGFNVNSLWSRSVSFRRQHFDGKYLSRRLKNTKQGTDIKSFGAGHAIESRPKKCHLPSLSVAGAQTFCQKHFSRVGQLDLSHRWNVANFVHFGLMVVCLVVEQKCLATLFGTGSTPWKCSAWDQDLDLTLYVLASKQHSYPNPCELHKVLNEVSWLRTILAQIFFFIPVLKIGTGLSKMAQAHGKCWDQIQFVIRAL